LEKMSKVLLTSKTAWSSRLCALTWKERDTKSGRSIFQLQASAPHTDAKECGSLQVWRTPDAHCDRGPSSEKRMKMKLEKGMPISINDQVAHPNLMWPTPNARDWKDSVNKVPPSVGKTRGHSLGMKVAEIRQQEQKMWPTPRAKEPGRTTKGYGRGLAELVEGKKQLWPTPTVDAATNRTTKYKQGGTSLALAAKMWPTPKERDYKGAEGKRVVETSTGWSKIRKGTKTKYGASLNDVAEHLNQKMWPTPTSTERSGINPKTGTGAGLSKAAKMWPTPRAALGMTMKLSQGMADLHHKKYLETEVAYVEKAPGGTLNPTWVEWLMGYPAGYTDLKDWEILSSRKSRKKSATPSLKQKEKNETTD